LIAVDWSPEQVSGYLQKEGKLRVSHEWICQHIYQDKRDGGILWKHLRCQNAMATMKNAVKSQKEYGLMNIHRLWRAASS